MTGTGDLTRNQALVLDQLADAAVPLGAYAILDQLRDQGFRAPLQVYRALDKLVELGLVHRLESLNAFVACQHRHGKDHGLTAFTICENCGAVHEFHDHEVADLLAERSRTAGFSPRKSTIEISGLCIDCDDA